MTTGLASSDRAQVHRSPRRSWAGDVARPATRGWYVDASGGFILETRDAWNPGLASLVFPRITSRNPLFPRFVRSPLDPGGQALLDLLGEETIAQSAVKDAIHRAKGLGDAMDTRRRQREARLRAAGFEEANDDQRTRNLATDVALMPWPTD